MQFAAPGAHPSAQKQYVLGSAGDATGFAAAAAVELAAERDTSANGVEWGMAATSGRSVRSACASGETASRNAAHERVRLT